MDKNIKFKKKLLKFLQVVVLQPKAFVHNLFADKDYGEAGFFYKKNPYTYKYRYANWGSRPYEYYFVKEALKKQALRTGF